jgi:FkbM family methyltransferase
LGVPLKLYQLVARVFPKRPIALRMISGPLRGRKLCANYALRPNYLLGTYEQRTADTVWSNLSPGQVAYDIGANIGYLSLVMARRVGPGGKVFSFEPAPNAYSVLQMNARVNRDIQFQPVHIALADTTGSEPFSFFDYDVVSRLGDHSQDWSDANVIDVTVETLDHYRETAELPSPNFVKIDVEGAEMRVLRGMEQTLRHARPTLLIEVHSDELEEEVRDYCVNLGYTCRAVSDEKPKHLLLTNEGERKNDTASEPRREAQKTP